MKKKDLGILILRDNLGKRILRKIIYSRMIFNFLLIFFQIFFFFLFIFKMNEYVEYFFGGSLALSFIFIIYLANCKGKHEFKMAWMVPVIIFPLFGIFSYLMYHLNYGGIQFNKKLQKVKSQTKEFLPDSNVLLQIKKQNSSIANLSHFLATQGNFFPSKKNKVDYFSCGEQFFPVLYEDLTNAKEFIFIEFFIIEADESWMLLLEILERKIKEGVEVRVLCDGFGSVVASTKEYQKYLALKGIKAQVFLPLIPFFSTSLNNRDHRKIVVIDGKTAFTGGVNIKNEYFNIGKNRFDYWKDNAIKIQGPAIRNLTTMFLQNWNVGLKNQKEDFAKYICRDYPEFSDEKGIVIPYGDDAHNQLDLAENVYLDIIYNAKKYLNITTPYVLLSGHLQDALIFAAERGVQVNIIVPSKPDHLVTFCVGKTYLKTLMDKGINIYLYQKGFIHSKTFVCDDKIATVGSVNLDYRSLYHHFECGTVLYNLDIIQEIKNDFVETLNDCCKMDEDSYKKIPKRHKFLGRVMRIFAPLM